MRVPDSDGALGEMADKIALPSHVDIEVRLLQMEGEAIEPEPKAEKEDGRRLAVLRLPLKIPEPRLPLAEREDKARPGPRDVRPIRPQMLQVRRDQIGKQALRLQKAGGSEENLPQRGDGVPERRRAAAMRRQRHDRLLGEREILGAHALHGSLEQRDRRLWAIEQERRQEHILRRLGDACGEDKENRRAQSDLAHRSRHRLRLEGLQRAPSPISYHAFDVARGNAHGQRRHGIHKRMVKSRALRRFRHSPLRRRADVRRAVHTVLQRGEAVVRIGLYDPEGLQGGGRERRNRPQEAKQGQIREKAKDDRRGEKQKEMIKVSTKR